MKFTALLFIPIFVLALTVSTTLAESQDKDFERLGLEFVDTYPGFSPVEATWLGDHRFDEKLDDLNSEARERKNMYLRKLAITLYEFEPEKLSPQNRIDYEMLRRHVEAELFYSTELKEWEWNPTIYTGMSGGAVYNLMAREFAPLEDRLDCVAARLEQFPRFLEEVRQLINIAKVPQTHAETAVKQNRGVLSILDNMVKPNLEKIDEYQRKRLIAAMETARAAIEEHQEWLEKELLPNARGDFRIGEKLFDKKLKFSLGTDMSREEVKKRAQAELRLMRDEMYEVAKKIYKEEHPWTVFLDDVMPPSTKAIANPPDQLELQLFKQAIIRSAIDIACRDLPARDKLVDFARETLRETTEFVKKKDFLTLPDDPVEIILMPEFQRGFSVAYCDSPGALDLGQKTFYAISPIPDEWDEKQVRSFLREYNPFSVMDLTIHEAMPGHYVQLALAGRYPGKLRALLSSGTFIEGWAVYTERLMVEQGFMEGDPRMKLIQLKWYIRAVTNAIIDQAIHCDGMERDEAMRLMIEQGFQEEREAALKWTRAQLSSTQLSTYFVGYQEVAAIRTECEKRDGEKFDLKSFHDLLLSFGSPHPQYVLKLMLDEE